MKEVAVGIDIGGTFTKYGIVDKEGNCLINGSISTVQEKDLAVGLRVGKLFDEFRIGKFAKCHSLSDAIDFFKVSVKKVP